MVTTEDLRDNLDRLTSAVERMANRLDELEVLSAKDAQLDQPRSE
jgi:hypothetical protein